MRTLTRRMRRLAVAAAGVAAACTLALPAAAQAATGYTPNSNQWYFNLWHIQQQVWPTTEGAGVTVAVLDSGVQASNPDLQGVVEPGADMLGDSGNGETDYASNGGHGTEVATLIAGQGIDNGPVGIAPQAKILPVHVTSPSGGSSVNAGTAEDNGIKYAVDHGAQVINMSNGSTAPSATSCDPGLQSAVNYALAHNVILFASAGDTNLNGSTPQEPATCPGVIGVGGVEPDGSLWSGSTQGSYVSLAAPGDHMYVVSADNQHTSTISNGTSFSAPLAAAAAALIRAANPSMPWYTVAQRLTDTAIPSGSVPNNGTGYGIINVAKAVNVSQYPVSSSAPNPVYARYQAYLKSSGQSGGAGTQPAQAAPSSTSTATSSSGSDALIGIIVVIVVIIIVVAVIFIVVRSRKNKNGPRNPGGGSGGPGYPPNPYGTVPGQSPQKR